MLASLSGKQNKVLLYLTAQWRISEQVNGFLKQEIETFNRDDMKVNGVITGLKGERRSRF